MTNLIVLSFTNEAQAIEASHKLIELESFGDISVFEKVTLKKDEYGNTSVIQSETSDGIRVAGGMAIGTLVGVLGGPVGMLVGWLTGTLVGAAAESDYFDFSDDVTDKVSNRLKPGTVAIVAEVSEDNPFFIDNAVAPLGASIFRTDVDYAYDEYIDDQVDEFDEEIANSRRELKSAAAKDRSRIQQRIAELKDKRKKRIAERKDKHQANVEERKGNRNENRKERLQTRINRHQTKISKLQDELKEIET